VVQPTSGDVVGEHPERAGAEGADRFTGEVCGDRRPIALAPAVGIDRDPGENGDPGRREVPRAAGDEGAPFPHRHPQLVGAGERLAVGAWVRSREEVDELLGRRCVDDLDAVLVRQPREGRRRPHPVPVAPSGPGVEVRDEGKGVSRHGDVGEVVLGDEVVHLRTEKEGADRGRGADDGEPRMSAVRPALDRHGTAVGESTQRERGRGEPGSDVVGEDGVIEREQDVDLVDRSGCGAGHRFMLPGVRGAAGPAPATLLR
jgi:hypothetical protein